MKTLQEMWREYRDMVYPEGIPAEQNRECHQAFFAGAFVALGNVTALAELPDAEAKKELQKLLDEVEEVCRFRIETLKNQN